MITSFIQLVARAHGTKTLKIAAALFITGALYPASAQKIYRTGFERPTFAAHLPLNGQDGWTAPPPLSPSAAVITSGKPRIGKQTVEVLGADLVHQDFIHDATGGYYDAIGSFRRSVDYDTLGQSLVRVSAYVRIDGKKTTPGNNFFSASVAVRAVLSNDDHAGVGELALSSDGNVYGYSGNEDVPTIQVSARVAVEKWHRLAVVVDFSTHKYSFFVDSTRLGTFDFDPNNVDSDTGAHLDYTNVLKRGSLVTYAAPDLGTLKKANYEAHFDQFAIRSLKKVHR